MTRTAEVLYVNHSDDALCVIYEGQEIWIPQSVITNISDFDLDEVDFDDKMELEIESWWADKLDIGA